MRFEYLNKIEGNWKIKLFYEFIQEKKLELKVIESDTSINKIFFAFLISVAENKSSDFKIKYSEFSKRKPSEGSPWLYDDFLLFVLIVGIVKFKIDKSWILKVIEERASMNIELKQINTTFLNLLIENYNSKDNLFELIYVFQEINNIPITPIDEINSLYKRLVTDNKLLETRNDFLKIIRLRSIDIIILKKELPNSQEVTRLKQFKSVFLKRINALSKIVNVLLVICLILGIYFFQAKSKSNQEIINTISVISGILGLGLLVFMKWVSKQIKNLILIVLGYSKVFNERNRNEID